MANKFRVNTLVLDRQHVTATGNNLYVNDILIGSGTYQATGDYALNSALESTGSQNWNHLNNNAVNLSGDIYATGSSLYDIITNFSGQSDNDYATKISLFQSGANLYALLTDFSGQADIDYATKVDLYQSGVDLMGRDAVISGVLNSQIVQTGASLSSRINNSGSALDNKVNVLSGSSVLLYGDQVIEGRKDFLDDIYINNLFVTGTQTIVNTEEVNVGSNWLTLNATGGARDAGIFISTGITGGNSVGAVIGYDVPADKWVFGLAGQDDDLNGLPLIASIADINAASGVLQSQINTLATSSELYQTGVILLAKINSLSGYSDDTFATITNLYNTGNVLWNRDLNISGGLETRITEAKGEAIDHANAVGAALSGDLFDTGSSNWTDLNNNGINISGVVYQTGSDLYTLVTNLSGQANNDFATKVALYQTGSDLYGLITNFSGQADANYATKIDLESTGRLSIGNFGQIASHFAYESFNTTPSGWGWSFVKNNNGGPSSEFAQWYRLATSLGAGFPYEQYRMELAIPRIGKKDIYIRTVENYVTGDWEYSNSGISGALMTEIGYLSGYSNLVFATKTALEATGSTLYSLVTNLSGQIDSNYVAKTGGSFVGKIDFEEDISIGTSGKDAYIYYDSTTSGNRALRFNSNKNTWQLSNNGRIFSDIQIKGGAGALSRPTITDNGDATIDISGVNVILYSHPNWTGSVAEYAVTGHIGLAIPYNHSSNYVGVNYNGGNPYYFVTNTENDITDSDKVMVASFYRHDNDLHYVENSWGLSTSSRINRRLVDTQTFIRTDGLSLSTDASSHILVSAGTLWWGIDSYNEEGTTSSGNNAEFWYHSGGSWYHQTRSTFNNAQYDDGTNLQAIGNNNYGVNWVYRFANSDSLEKIAYTLGNGKYSNLAGAAAALVPPSPDILDKQAILVGRVIVRQGSSGAAQVDSAFDQVFAGTTVTNHNNLGGLQGGTGNQFYHLNAAQYSGYIGRTEVGAISGALSSRLSATGIALRARDTAISGGLETRIRATGSVNWNHARNNAVNLSGNLQSTGSALYGMTTALSGEFNNKLESTGSANWNHARNNAINLSGVIYETGSYLYQIISAFSGQSDTDFATKVSLYQTGSDLYALITDFSGQADVNYATKIDLTQSGIDLMDRDAVISGALNSRMVQTGAGLSTRIDDLEISVDNKVNALSGDAVLIYGDQVIEGRKDFLDNIYINNLFVTGTQTVVNTEEVNVASNWVTLNATGGARDAGIFVSTGVTGSNAVGAVIGYDVPANRWVFGLAAENDDLNGLPIIASIADINAASGVLQTQINTLATSDALYNTGVVLLGVIDSLSGYSDSTFATIANLRATGSANWNHARNNAVNLSGNLGATGSTLNSKINSLSGYAAPAGVDYVYTTGEQIVLGPKSFNDISLSATGQINPTLEFSGVSGDGIRLEVLEDGSIAFIGNAGGLFGISDGLTGSLMSVNNIAGLPIFEVYDSDKVVVGAFATNALVVSGSGIAIGTDYVYSNRALFVSGDTRYDGEIYSGTTNISDLFYPRLSNPSGYVTGGELSTSGSYLYGLIAQTGSSLYSLLTSASGELNTKIESTGEVLYSILTSASGEFAPAKAQYVYQTGNQNISGNKTFFNQPIFNDIIRIGSSSLGDADRLYIIPSNTGLFSPFSDFNVIQKSKLIHGGNLSTGVRLDWSKSTLSGDWYTNTTSDNPISVVNLSKLDSVSGVIDSHIDLVSGYAAPGDAQYVYRTGDQTINGEKIFNDDVGIGESSPAAKLHVYRNATMGNIDSPALSNAVIRVTESSSRNMYIDGNAIYTDTSLALGTVGDGSVVIGTNSVTRFTVDPSGRVGIGTSSPETMLYVDGDSRFEENVLANDVTLAATGQVNPTLSFSGVSGNGIRLEVLKDGTVSFIGNAGGLFTISDSLTGSLMSVTDIGGLPILEVFDTDKVVMGAFSTNAFVVTGSGTAIGTDYLPNNRVLFVSGNTEYAGDIFSGDTNIVDLFYPRLSNPSGYVTGGELVATGITLLGVIEQTGSTLYSLLTNASGEFAPANANYVYTTGNQTIGGQKTFTNTLSVDNTELVIYKNATIGAITSPTLSSASVIVEDSIATGWYDANSWFSNEGISVSTVALKPITFGTNNAERMRIESDGNVAIGLTSASEKLHVDGFIRSDSGFKSGTTNLADIFATSTELESTGSANWNHARNNAINLSGNLAATGSTLNSKIDSLSGHAAPGDANYVYTTGNQSIGGEKTFTNDVYISKAGPRLEIKDTNASAQPAVAFYKEGEAAFATIKGIRGDSAGVGNIEIATDNGVTHSTKMVIQSGGNVGIGTTSPTEVLHVAGDSRFEENALFNDITLAATGGVNPTLTFSGVSGDGIRLEVLQDGSIAFVGSAGNLFGISDSLTGSLMSVTDIVGLPIFEVFDSNKVVAGQYGTNALVVSGSGVALGSDSIQPNRVLFVSGNTKYDGEIYSGDTNITDLFYPRLSNPSGYVTGGELTASGELFLSRIEQTGSANWNHARNNAINLSGNLVSTGSILNTKINDLSGVSVHTYGDQLIRGRKDFLDNTYINNLFVTGTQTIVNTQEVDVASNWITINATGGARDGGIFISTGLTGASDIGAIIGFDVPSNKWVVGLAGQDDDLSVLPVIATINDIDDISGWAAPGAAQYVYRTGNQTIAGDKTFNDRIYANNFIGFDNSSTPNGITYEDVAGDYRTALQTWTAQNIVAVANRGANGIVQIRANTSTAGDVGERIVAEFQDDKVWFLTGGLGNVGIGAATPSASPSPIASSGPTLQIGDHATRPEIRLAGANGQTVSSKIVFDNSSVGDGMSIVFSADVSDIYGPDGIFFYNENGTDVRFKVNRDSLGVGIGTGNPQQDLHVYNDNGNVYTEIQRQTQAQGNVGIVLDGGVGGESWIMYQAASDDKLRFYGNGADRMAIDTAGNVGIGTNSPVNDLHIVTASTASIKVETSIDSQASLHLSSSGIQKGIIGYYQTDDAVKISHSEAGTSLNDNHLVVKDGEVGIGTPSPAVRLHVAGAGGTIAGSNLANADFLVGTTTNGIGIDTNEIYSNGADLNIGTVGSDNVIIRPQGGTIALTIGNNITAVPPVLLNNTLYVENTSLFNNNMVVSGTISAGDFANAGGWMFQNNVTSSSPRTVGLAVPTYNTVDNQGDYSLMIQSRANNIGEKAYYFGARGLFTKNVSLDSRDELLDGSNNSVVFGLPSGGKIGVGTLGPRSWFEVTGDSAFRTGVTVSGDLSLKTGQHVELGQGGIKLEIIDSDEVAFVGSQGTLFTISDSLTGSLMSVTDIGGLPILEVFDSDKVVMGQFGSNALVVTGNKVGIGTDAPTEKLHISGSGIRVSDTYIGQLAVANAWSQFSHYNFKDDVTAYALLQNGSDGRTYLNSSNLIELRINNSSAMIVDSNSKVGIGATTPTGQLEIYRNATIGSISSPTLSNAGLIIRDNGAHGYIDANSWFSSAGMVLASMAGNIQLATNAEVRLHIDDDGKVGIGETSPNELLHLKSAGSAKILLEADTDNVTETDNAQIRFSQDGNLVTGFIGFVDGAEANIMTMRGSESISIGISGSDDVFLEKNTRHLGIGTTAPQYPLHLNGKLYVNDVDSTAAPIHARRALSNCSIRVENNSEDVYFGINASGNASIGHDANQALGTLQVTSAGNVGIGTLGPAEKLEVQGGRIRASNASAPGDYVEMYDNGSVSYIESAVNPIYLESPTDIRIHANNSAGGDVYIVPGSAGFTKFRRDTVDDMIINTDGKVGIGTITPTGQLQVYRNATIGAWGALTTSNAGLTIQDSNSVGWLDSNSWFTDGAMLLGTTTAQQLTFGTNDTQRMIITSAGKVGINETVPDELLHIKETADDFATIKIESTSAGVNSASSLYLLNNLGDGSFLINHGSARTVSRYGIAMGGWTELLAQESVNGLVIGCGTTDNPIVFGNNDLERMRVDAGGNVGINNNNPQYNLHVSGSFAATTKSFVIDHPTKEGKKLEHGVIEGPSHKVYVDGKSNSNVIELPEYWTKLVDESTICIQLTPIGKPHKLFVKKIENNKVFISKSLFDFGKLSYYYNITAERADIPKLEVEK